jgi:glycosyl hydrolase family 39 (putative alpha-L-iduronidase)
VSKRVPFGKARPLLGVLIAILACNLNAGAIGAKQPPQITIHWEKVTAVSNTTPTLQVVVNPPLRPGEPLATASYKALKELGADYVRYVPWLPYPKLAVAELDPPTAQKTSWDFSLIDPMAKDFFAATDGHPTVMNFSTIPAWLFKTDTPVSYPADPNQVFNGYTQGTELRDPTGKDLGDYYARLVSWYVDGGFTDEDGVRHDSGYHYKFPVWEVLNEIEFEHKTTPEQYTARYDAIVSAIHKVSPDTKFMGMALGWPGQDPQYFEYFLDHRNHKPGIPLDYISYHFYASPTRDQTIDNWQYTFFYQADGFLNTVRYAEAIRKRLSPETKVSLDELGVILPTDNKPGDNVPPPAAYWNLAGALYADLFIEFSRMQIDIVGESQLVGYPTQYPSVSMMDWTTNQPNARFWVLKLIKDSFHPGDKLVETAINTGDVAAQAFITAHGRKLLIVNKRNREVDITLPGADKASALAVDTETGDGPARSVQTIAGAINLEPFAVAVVSW